MLVLIVTVFFLLSLVGAYVLFKVLKSSAVINRPGYQAGGALAGFLLIFGTLAITHQKLSASELDENSRRQLKARITELEQALVDTESLCEFDHWMIKGTVVRQDEEPRRHRGIKVSVIPHQTASSGFDGSFTIRNIKLARAEQTPRELQFSLEGYHPQDLTVVDQENADFDAEKKIIKLHRVELFPVEDPNGDVVELE